LEITLIIEGIFSGEIFAHFGENTFEEKLIRYGNVKSKNQHNSQVNRIGNIKIGFERLILI